VEQQSWMSAVAVYSRVVFCFVKPFWLLLIDAFRFDSIL
jgi:hypothetical protein